MLDLTTFTPWVLFSDLGIITAMLLIGKLIRAKIKIVQKLFIPPSMIAGVLALALGPNGTGWLPLSGSIATYPAVLIAIVFGALPLSSPSVKAKEVGGRVGPMWAYAQFGMLFQWAIMGLFGLLVMKALWPNLHDAFGVMLPTGFYGGHGTAAAIGAAFNGMGWEEAASLGMTTATIGVVIAIIGGLLFIKVAAKHKQTSYISDFGDLPDELRSGLLPTDKREASGTITTSPISIDSLTFHLAMVIVAAFGGYLISIGAKMFNPRLELPIFSCAFVVGLLLKLAFNKTKVSNYIDGKTTSSISSAATDFLVAFGIASIKLSVVVKYAVPLAVLIVVGTALTIFTVFYFGRHLHKKDWFEKSLFAWGWWTGTMAMGIALLRIVDPKMSSKAMDDYALAYLPCAPIEIILITLVPIMFSNGQGMPMMVGCLALSLLVLAVAWRARWWVKNGGRQNVQPHDGSSSCEGK